MRRSVIALVLASGCDYVLGLEPNSPPLGDGGVDAAERDAAPGCWTTERQEHDEDNDRRMDGCDNCPATFNEQQEDDDGDGVGNRCDPSNSVMHRIAMFRSFDTPAELAGFTAIGGTWEIANDSAVQVETTTAVLSTTAVFRDAVVLTAAGMPSAPGAVPAQVGVYASLSASGRLQCLLRRGLTASSVHLERVGGDGATSEDAMTTLATQNSIALHVTDATTSAPLCAVTTAESAELGLPGIGPIEGAVALTTGDSIGQFRYLLVIVRR